jgi:serine/threonine protein kinase
MTEAVKTVGRYEVLRELGRGGMAVVYLARQVDLDRPVALKELAAFHASDPAFARRFVRESRMAGSLAHANVVTVFEYFEHAGMPYISMEYVERGSLRPYVGRIRPAQIGGVLENVLAGLSAAEARGIVHRDLKPENLMVDSGGRVKIADFGIAKATQSSEMSAFVTATGATVGTPPYMSPEQAMAKEVGPWTDLYSVGCVAYELFTGRAPFIDADSPMAILLRHIGEPLASASEVAGVDPAMSAWIERMTAKEPAERPQSAAEAWEELEEVLIGMLGPRWRRESRLGEPPGSVPGPYTPPPERTPSPVEGIDLEGTGPDTPAPVYEAYSPPPTLKPPVEPPPPPEPPPAASPAPESEPGRPAAPAPPAPAASGLARGGAVALLAVAVIAALADGPDRWNLFAVLPPFEAVAAAPAVWWAAERRSPFTAGVLLGLGVLMTAGAIGMVKFAVERLDGLGGVLAIVLLAGAVAILAAGVNALRASPAGAPGSPDPGALVLGLAGTALAGAALFTRYDGFSSLWSEVGETESAEFFFEPAVAVMAMLVALLVVLALRRELAAGLLVALGAATALHFLGVIVAAWRAIGEVGDIRAAGFIGLLGGLLVLAAGASARVRR